MRTNIISFVLGSERRIKIVRTIFEYPKRQWSCSFLEELTKIPHTTVFRTLAGLKRFNILKTTRINKRDIMYELADSPLSKELEKIINIEKTAVKKIIARFVNKIKDNNILSIILYGSAVKEDLRPESDIDLLIILKAHNQILEREIFDIAAELSSRYNQTISVSIMDAKELNKEKDSQFIISVKDNMEVIYGEKPF